MKIDNVNILLLLVGIILILSGIFTADRMNWFLDVVWVIVGLPIVSVSRKYLKLTPLLYWLMAVHSLFLIGGGYYTYEQMPLGLWAQEVFGLARNH
jgi:putative membrane protein